MQVGRILEGIKRNLSGWGHFNNAIRRPSQNSIKRPNTPEPEHLFHSMSGKTNVAPKKYPVDRSFLPQRSTPYSNQPITTFVIKVASRCNLACTYCYMYEHPDQTWQQQPALMSVETIRLLANRLSEYVRDRNLKRILVVAHGGEPLLLGDDGLRNFFSIIRAELSDREIALDFGLQTNATLVTEETVQVLQDFNVRAGVSIDGPARWNDVARIDHSGNGSFARVMTGVEKLRNPNSGASVFGGFLTVANPNIEPTELLSFFETLKASAIDLLLPDFNHNTYQYWQYPAGVFGRWLAEVFDLWLGDGSDMEIRLFKILMKLVLGGRRGYDALGSLSDGVVIIETDGSYHALDVLKTAYHGATVTGKSLTSHPIADLESEPLVRALSVKSVSAHHRCLSCHVFETCGGGYLPHRYRDDSGFDNASVFCMDLMFIIDHIRKRLASELMPKET